MKRRELLKNIGIGVGAAFVAPTVLASTLTKAEPAFVASSLDRVNTVRLVNYIRREIGAILHSHIFEVNDDFTRRAVVRQAHTLLTDLVNRGALYDYMVVCDESNNIPKLIDNGGLYMDIAIQRTNTDKFIYIPAKIVYDSGEVFNPRSTRKDYWFADAGSNGNFGGSISPKVHY